MDDMPHLEDTISQVIMGRTDLYENIVRYYEQYVFSVAVRVTFDRDLAYDVTQETFVKLYSSLARFRGTSKLSSYLYRIASNCAIDAVRRKSQHPVASGETQADLLTAEAPEMEEDHDGPTDDEVREGVRAALQNIDPRFRAAFSLVDLDGLTYDEAAATLGVPSGTVKSRVFRAREQLRELLAGTFREPPRPKNGEQ
ncbi:MAG TPA: sigma-70 family RNA polymerase sigma factor [Candidatus Cryosericum sp.]|nr:sigma-70 family RNA polymerase sigma factor [Candidatus Cryosericum sp.]